MISSKITGTGAYIPSVKKDNSAFANEHFLNEDGSPFTSGNDLIIEKFKAITGIAERRYAKPAYNTSDLAFFASQKAIEDAGVNPEELDYIILAHNFGDVQHQTIQSDNLPNLATRVKFKLGIENPNCVAYDILFGCPGWVEGVIQAQAFIKAGIAKKCLVIGTETLSRVVDENDRDSMIFSDGAAAVILEQSKDTGGIIAHESATYAVEEANYIYFGESFNPEPGFYFGAMYVSYGLGVAQFVATWVALIVLGVDSHPAVVFAWVLFIVLALAPLSFRLSRKIWINAFVKYEANPEKKMLNKEI